MVALYVGGQKVDWADAEQVLSTLLTEAERVELRNDAGKVLGVVVPKVTSQADDPDWVKAVTPEEIKRRLAGPFLTLDEYRKQVGQQ